MSFFNYSSTLFSGMNSSGSSFSGLIGEYNQIRNGTYGKLLKAYYKKYNADGTAKSSTTDTNKTTNKVKQSSDTVDTAKELDTVKDSATALQNAAMKLAAVKEGSSSLYAKKTIVDTNEDGSTGQLGGDWPSNEFTKQVPKPPFELTAASTEESAFSVAFLGVDLDDLRDYVEELKNKGFTEDVESEDTEVFGIVMFTYAASNSKGYRVEVTSAVGVCGLTITKE